jgi:hypothetical protein
MHPLEAVSQDADTRRIVLRLAALSRRGAVPAFLAALDRDRALDDETKGQVAELARDEGFLLAAEDYLLRTARMPPAAGD